MTTRSAALSALAALVLPIAAQAAEFTITVPVAVAVRPEAKALRVSCEITTNGPASQPGGPFASGAATQDLANGRFEGNVTVNVSTPIATNPQLRLTGYRCALALRFQRPDGQMSDWLSPDDYQAATHDLLTGVQAASEGALPASPITAAR